jgi:hypothetical protein
VVIQTNPQGQPGPVLVSVTGTHELLIEIAQQISWLSAAVRLPVYGEVSLSDILFRRVVDTKNSIHNRYSVTLLPLKRLEPSKDLCWHPLLRGTVIARDFPVPLREQEKGMELPFHLMLTLVGDLYPMSHAGGIYLQGHSRLLFPTAISNEGNIQWHLEATEDRRQGIAPGMIHELRWVKINDPRYLASARTFLGHYRSIVIDLGTERSLEYYRAVSYSGADDEEHGLSVQAPSSVTWGSSGCGIFGMTVTNPIVYGKALAQTISDSDDEYLDVLDSARDRPIILLDNDENSLRAWMVPAICVIYHMVHIWASRYNECLTNAPRAPLSWNANSTCGILRENGDHALRNMLPAGDGNQKTVKTLVMQFWKGIVQRAGKELLSSCDAAPEMAMQSSQIYAWELMDFIRGEQSLRKQIDFIGNWKPFTKDVLVLVGKRFGDVIRPAPGISVCQQWNPVPSQRMYLTATIDCLQMLSYKRGGHREILDSARLTNRGYWYYQTDDLFEDCGECIQGTAATRIRCTKVPQSLDESPRPAFRCLTPPKEGAVVFGHRKLQKTFPAPSPAGSGQQTRVDRSARVMQWTTTAIRSFSRASRSTVSVTSLPNVS